ncbi:MAG: OsmC family protein [Gammaproteobacteria bacterium]|nr:OsmC family protein [Gammaproteobacteria bacterium]MBT8125599.1 OsmC family protein [Gammaproteobacteria bacterium]NNC68712.1 OsmC family protein [Gammaproteobacteria bacterium]
MQVRIKWLEQRAFQAETGSGHSLTMDGPPEHGGRNLAARPMEMVLVGLGGCSAFDVVEILEKSRQKVKDCQIGIDAERADDIPAVFTKIHMHFIIGGDELNEKHVKRAVELSAEKYCSVAKMLRPNVEITYDYEMG